MKSGQHPTRPNLSHTLQRLLSLRSASQTYLIQLLLLIAVAGVFFPVCSADFVNYDDNINVYENVRVVDFSIANLLYFWREPYQGLYLPLTYTLWGCLAKVSTLFSPGKEPLSPLLFHGTNLLLHGAAVLVLFQILRLALKHVWAAAAGALLFAVHPVQVETVAWVTGLKDLLCGLFSLLALWQYLIYAESGQEGPPGRKKHYGLATLFLAAALLSKPGAVAIPLVAAVLGYFLLRRTPRQLALELGGWVLLALPVILVTKLSQPNFQDTFVPAIWQRFLVAGDAISFYLGKIVLPAGLAPDYGRTPQYVLSQGWVYGTGLFPYLLVILLLGKYPRPWALAASGTFVASLFPVLGFSPFHFQEISTVADRYLYTAMLGPALALGWGLSRCQRAGWWWGVGAVLVGFGLASVGQVRHWQTSLLFNNYAILMNPRSATAHINLGVALKEAGRIEEAMAAYQKAITLDPHNLQPYLNLGNRYKDAAMSKEAISYYKKAIEVDPADAEAYFRLGGVYRDQGETFAALSNYEMGLERRPDFAKGYADLGLLYKSINRDEDAISAYLKAIAANPDFAEVYNNLGLLYEKEDKEKAILMYQKALAIKPDLGEAANNLGYLYLELQRDSEAIPLFQKAVAVYPENPLPHNNLGLAYFNLGQFKEATVWFQKAILVNPSFAPAFHNLSRLKLQLGEIDSALDYAEKAKGLGLSDPAHLEALRQYRKIDVR